MGRKRNHFLRDLFVEKNHQAKCKSCGQNISNYTTNLKRHLKKNHSEIFNNVAKKFKPSEYRQEEMNMCGDMAAKESLDISFRADEDNNAETKFLLEISKEEINPCSDMTDKESPPLLFAAEDDNVENETKFLVETSKEEENVNANVDMVEKVSFPLSFRPEDGNNMEIKTKFLVEMSKEEVTKACVDMVIKESLPFSFFDSNSFKVLTNPLFDGLRMDKVNSRNVMDLVMSKSEEIKTKIKDMLKYKLINLKIDTATRNDQSMLGISVQIITRDKIKTISLAMLDLKNSHNAGNIKFEIEKVLEHYKIKNNQLYSVTTDNGRNFIKDVELEPLQTASKDIGIGCEYESPDQIQNIINNIRFKNIISYQCPAHILQLAIKDFLRQYVADIERARHAVNVLRAATFRSRFIDCTLPKLQLDVPTQWTSTYKMLKRLLELKEFCLYNLSKSEQLKISEWHAIENMVSVLGAASELILKLQGSQLLLGDFYKNWMALIFNLKNIDSDASKELLIQIESRQSVLLENETMYAALYVDPRFRRLLSNAKREIAKKHLKKIFQQMQSLQKENCDSLSSQMKLTKPFVVNESSIQSSFHLLRTGLREMEASNLTSDSDDDDVSDINDDTRKAFYEIENYKEKRMDIDEDFIEYWNSKKFVLPWLRKLAFIVHAVPATQVSVERLFSALQLIVGDRRHNLSEDNFEAIMVAKFNSDNI